MSDIEVAKDSFAEMLDSLVRGDPNEFLHLLSAYDVPLRLQHSMATVRTHFVSVDANGQPAIDLLATAMARAAMDFCIPRSRIEQALKHLQETGSTSQFSRLEQQARELFVDGDGTGEGGELLLFLLMEQVLQLPQLLAKMSLKTNNNVHVHGSDGVHAKLGEDGVLDLYWGESKLYKSSSDAFTDCFDSIGPFLGADGDTRRRDLLLVRENLNVQQDELAAHLLQYFDETNSKALKVRWNGVCLIGFDYAAYPDMTKLADAHEIEIAKAVKRWQTSIRARLEKNALLEVNIDVFCVPFPDVDAMRKAVRKKLGVA
ncbi:MULTISPECIES: DUF1837 domain-containing protein [unclassified Microbacterium]|uniref:HamA C-terminal domain-containing protein n=1 Tax=unclassified Microbacterium TaxID=2609290 RepID=UPI000EA9CC30|nr:MULTISPECIES: DUF1837 domain-containing protein [unclassified Microbacterium]MBT2486392.1 DUF1837 domain-containing protein [Microbacterium sp. ISL-108]RKN69096.1 DUF1837 domain-containing protein [Microbacterium sp. CGR2]